MKGTYTGSQDPTSCLNPCYNGIKMKADPKALIKKGKGVLILVLMEYKWNIMHEKDSLLFLAS